MSSSTMHAVHATRSRRAVGMLFIPAALLMAWAMLTANGSQLTPKARAATSSSVNVTGTIAANMSMSAASTNPSFAITLAAPAGNQASFSGGDIITFGANNDGTTKFTTNDSDGGNFFVNGGNSFTDTAAACAALGTGADYGGMHILSTNMSANVQVSAAWGATTCKEAAGANAKFKPVPDSATDTCEQYQGAGSAANTCELEWGVNEFDGNAASGNFVGTANLTMVNY